MCRMSETDLGLRIRRARERKRWSQQQLADALGVGTRSVGRWERGEAVPRSSIGAIEDVLGVELDDDPDVAEFYAGIDRLRKNKAVRDLNLDLDAKVREFEQLRRRQPAGRHAVVRAS